MPNTLESPNGVAFDRLYHAALGRVTAGLSPAALTLAFTDWFVHLAMAPGKRGELVQKAARKAARLSLYAVNFAGQDGFDPCIEPLGQDKRFRDEAWQKWPFDLIYQGFLLNQQWWHNATTDIPGVSGHHQDAVSFTVRQMLDVFSPSNFLVTNPELLKVTLEQGGRNLFRGFENWLEDWERATGGKPPVGTERFVVGRDLAITPGQVVFRNRLIELIQYTPDTDTVWKEPVLVVPAWIMKFYILDLQPQNSLVRYLVSQGHTVFVVSWKNPDASDRDLDMEDYRRSGVSAALKAISAIVPNTQVHGVGYCLGGTLLSIAAAKMARDEENRLQTLTLLAAQTDFTEAGELTLFIDEAQLSYLEDIMWEQGFLDTRQMAGAFQLLRSNDLIWSAMVHDYLLGERQPMVDLMAWNADTTRMPYRMHAQYLRQLFLNNDLAEGRYLIGGRPVTLSDIRVPICAVGTESDHVAPWRSVYKIHLLSDSSETAFILTNGGHNAGIVSEPGHPRRYHRMSRQHVGDRYMDPDTWIAATSPVDGSWWPAWSAWLTEHSSGRCTPPGMGAADRGYFELAPAPGSYVLQS
jgi:polyhydroxyalkanoate synthase